MLKSGLHRGERPAISLELEALALGQTALTMNAEVFSRFIAVASPGVVPHFAIVGCTME